jgi:hypothetical protein
MSSRRFVQKRVPAIDVAALALWHAYAPWLIEQFKVDEKELGGLTLNFFANVRIVIVFFFLVPALALHWSAKKA